MKKRLLHIWWLIFFITSPLISAVTLQPHQDYTLNYLLKKPKQKGLLIYHSLGSGKTYLSLAYIEKFPNKEVVIVLPRFLKANWITQIKSFGVKNPKRIRFIAFNEAARILPTMSLKNKIVIVDEIHKLIYNIKTAPASLGKVYSQLYFKLFDSYKILALSGTPIFDHSSDIAYIGNILLGKRHFPFNPDEFKNKYMKINPGTALFRGQLFESKFFYGTLPVFSTVTGVVLFTSLGTVPAVLLTGLATLSGSIGIPVLNSIFPAHTVQFRKFDAEKFSNFSSNYVSYFLAKTKNDKHYPTTEFFEHKVHYTSNQVNFFLDFADEALTKNQLKIMMKDTDSEFNDHFIELNSSNIQKSFLHNPSSGREIGNYSFIDKKGNREESEKFNQILALIKNSKEQVAVYSNYFYNGIVQFAHFLKRNGMAHSFRILHPDHSSARQIKTVADYNRGAFQVLLIHPEITEGISLKKTEQFHILEPVPNIALQNQIVGRAVRYQSHSNLPKERQKVKVHLWESTISYSGFMGIPTEAGFLKQKHWEKRFAEMNPNSWTKGILDIDPNFRRKEETPDARVKRSQSQVAGDMTSFQDLVTTYSIENPISDS